ncbi:coiled-coil-helix-coiled-coil-helix domain containing 1 (predicted), isoform CRA_b [Rattus norvegicus]|uniref:Coiled-coil-helix-coiled-coil-helix domain containing 1 (Predicted), isoform CRA_b n=1 Tax=Rattus norvegicus TaxID=10116 RepID=A6KKQ0_RAT|nr:coiled-coil-helix-coiled-coil-helix domain containing 1 (predicted), isoform CRA_b [Rattus norvegicus]
MATPSLRGRLARFANPGKPILKPNKPLILANRVGNRRREKGGEHLEWERPGNIGGEVLGRPVTEGPPVLPLQRQLVSRRCQ